MCGKHCKRDSCIDAIESASCSVGYPELRSLQRRAVVSFVSGKDVFVCIPTGGGKSLCYSILPRVFNLREKESSMVIIVGPFYICIQPGHLLQIPGAGYHKSQALCGSTAVGSADSAT